MLREESICEKDNKIPVKCATSSFSPTRIQQEVNRSSRISSSSRPMSFSHAQIQIVKRSIFSYIYYVFIPKYLFLFQKIRTVESEYNHVLNVPIDNRGGDQSFRGQI